MFVTRLFLLLMARAIKVFEPIFCVYGYGKNDMIEDIRLFDASHNIYTRFAYIYKLNCVKKAPAINHGINLAITAYSQTV